MWDGIDGLTNATKCDKMPVDSDSAKNACSSSPDVVVKGGVCLSNYITR
jgi:hypothetical protein